MLQDFDLEFATARAEIQSAAVSDDGRQRLRADFAKTRKASDDQTIRSDLSPHRRTRVAEKTRREILDAAMKEFAAKGLNGARVDAIAARTSITKPMIYYHFGSKEKLYAAVMEEAYGGVRSKEQDLNLGALTPVDAMRRLVEVTFDHHAEHPEYVRLVSGENIEKGRHIAGRPSLVERNAIAIDTVRDLLDRGEKDGTFRSGIDPWHLHFLISSYCFMRVSNRYSWRAVFDKDLWDQTDVPAQREMIVDVIMRYLNPHIAP
ncbi:TetR family transcriptional regulator [Cohaesibacter celericrescens]|uniref:TetR family transcriptional regulator n=2 Tax=Cohaesibacter celericrescens TaxID=2067669 RepID=A0A2N5XRQ2_9HYPH|nr:TetR family transcriptional regulator [Cohaesibacter celericrescens]